MTDPVDPYASLPTFEEGEPSAPAAREPQETPKPTGHASNGPGVGGGILDALGGTALGAAGLYAASKFPELKPALAKLAAFASRHPYVASTFGGAGVGGAAATPHAIATGHPEEIGEGAAAGAMAGPAGALVARQIPKLAPLLTTSGPERVLARAELANATDPSETVTRLRSLATQMRQGVTGKNAANPSVQQVGDVVGPQGQALSNAALASPTPEAAAYGRSLQARQAGTGDRVQEAINQSFAPTPYDEAEKQYIKAKETNAAPLYTAAYSQFPSVQSDVFNRVTSDPVGAKAAQTAADKWSRLFPGTPIGPIGPGEITTAPSLQYHQFVKEELDKMIGKMTSRDPADRASAEKTDLRSLEKLRNDYVSDLDQKTMLPNGTSPYADARGVFAGDAAVLNALGSGRNEFPTMDISDLRERMDGYGPGLSSEKEAFLSGVAENLATRVAKVRMGSNPVAAIAKSPEMKDRLSAVFDSPVQAQNFIDRLDQEYSMFEQTKGKLRSASQGATAAVSPPPGKGSTVVKAGLHSINPKLAVLRSLVDSLTPGKVPAGPIATMMGKSGIEGSNQLNRIGDVAERLSGLKARLGPAGAIGAAGAGATAGAAIPQMLEAPQQQP